MKMSGKSSTYHRTMKAKGSSRLTPSWSDGKHVKTAPTINHGKAPSAPRGAHPKYSG